MYFKIVHMNQYQNIFKCFCVNYESISRKVVFFIICITVLNALTIKIKLKNNFHPTGSNTVIYFYKNIVLNNNLMNHCRINVVLVIVFV